MTPVFLTAAIVVFGAALSVFLARDMEVAMPKLGSGTHVFHLERAAGLSGPLRGFLGWWEMHGEFPLTIPSDGGLRLDEAHQRALYLAGKSRAATLAETAHGRGGAVDLYPAKVVGNVVTGIYLPENDGVEATVLFEKMGAQAKRFGLVWGGSWPDFPDLPHVQDPNWRNLPFPPLSARGVS